MIDREGRDLLATKLRAYMSEEILSGELEEVIDSFYESQDQTLAYLYRDQAEWFHLDLDDCRTWLTMAEWGRLNNILLLLESDAEIECDGVTRLTWRQPVAWIAILIGLVFSAALGVRFFTDGYFLPFMLLALLFYRHVDVFQVSSCYPFPTLVSMARVRRRVAGFSQEPFPGDRRQKDRPSGLVRTAAGFILIWPFLLVVGAVPVSNRHYRVTIDGILIDAT